MPSPQSIIRVASPFLLYLEQFYKLQIDRSPLGHGHWGVVFRTSDPGKVFKVSVDPTEGPIWQAFLNSGLDKQLKGLATCYSLLRLPAIYAWRKHPYFVWAILRENINPRPAIRAFGMGTYEEREEAQASNAMMKYFDASRDFVRLKTRYKKQMAEERMEEAVGNLYNHQPSYFVAELIEEARRTLGIVMTDVHFGNIGYRTMDDPENEKYASNVEWTVFDPGHSSIEDKPEVMEFVMPKVATNPVPVFG